MAKVDIELNNFESLIDIYDIKLEYLTDKCNLVTAIKFNC